MEQFNIGVLKCNQLLKGFSNLGELTKGEGDRGGTIIGHTSSGKPIYHTHTDIGIANKFGNSRPELNYSKQDHVDAAALHDKLTEQYDAEECRIGDARVKANGGKAGAQEQELRKLVEHHSNEAEGHIQASRKIRK